MTKTEIISSFSTSQREEFDRDIEHMIQRTGIEYDFDSTKVAEVNTNMRLQGEVFLNVTLLFYVDANRKVTGEISEIIKFASQDEYLDSISKARTPAPGFKKIKP